VPDRRGIIRIVIILLLVYALLCFARAGQTAAEMERKAASLEREVETLEMEHADLERRLRWREDPARMEALARRELGMVMPGETVFLFAEEDANSVKTERNPICRWK
jgi:cell division protein FtsB